MALETLWNHIRFECYPHAGPLHAPTRNPLWSPGAYPLCTELYISEKQAKANHDIAITSLECDFVYIVNAEIDSPSTYPSYDGTYQSYLGTSGIHELTLAYSHDKVLYAAAPIDPAQVDWEPLMLKVIQAVRIMPATAVAKIWQQGKPSNTGFHLPRKFIEQRQREQGFIDYMEPVHAWHPGKPLPSRIPENWPPPMLQDIYPTPNRS